MEYLPFHYGESSFSKRSFHRLWSCFFYLTICPHPFLLFSIESLFFYAPPSHHFQNCSFQFFFVFFCLFLQISLQVSLLFKWFSFFSATSFTFFSPPPFFNDLFLKFFFIPVFFLSLLKHVSSSYAIFLKSQLPFNIFWFNFNSDHFSIKYLLYGTSKEPYTTLFTLFVYFILVVVVVVLFCFFSLQVVHKILYNCLGMNKSFISCCSRVFLLSST